MRPIEFKDYGESFAQIYDRMVPPVSDLAQIGASIAQALEDGKNASVVELGVGTGRVAIPLSAELRRRYGESLKYIGVDGSSEMLDKLRERDLNHQVISVAADVTSWRELQETIRASSVDVVFCVGGTFPQIQSSDAQFAAFANASRMLRRGGKFVIECHNPTAVQQMVSVTAGTMTVRYPASQTALVWFSTIDDKTGIWDIEEVWIEGTVSTWLRETTLLTAVETLDSYASQSEMKRVDLTGAFGESTPYSEQSMMYTATYEKC
ncbi:class I SAM-dependent methyltransferase [Leucobacter coleopterorum]|uniref:Class I SAM-dependent methyltransferase n=1 Tax=Leucobacter coleopterorum TaxID=2714933 RepID=A0ABX6JTW2_9MICO|nr:class I SAM-dependent methyltransferase [Leucobacter coleopterorum]QIM17728.1 class I SAM-dependent methyltransferase [Leucobacter coleopterorum]